MTTITPRRIPPRSTAVPVRAKVPPAPAFRWPPRRAIRWRPRRPYDRDVYGL